MNILIADDSIITQKLMQSIFTRLNHSFNIVPDGEEAVQEFGKNEYDFVLLDLHMPKKDGIEAAKEIHQIKPDAKIIIISGEKSSDLKSRFKEMNIYKYLEKPFSLQDVENIFKG